MYTTFCSIMFLRTLRHSIKAIEGLLCLDRFISLRVKFVGQNGNRSAKYIRIETRETLRLLLSSTVNGNNECHKSLHRSL